MTKTSKRSSNTSSKKSISSNKISKGQLRTRSFDLKINGLPTDILLKIFSFLPLKDLFLNVRLVCRKWYFLAASSELWETINIGPEISRNLLFSWLENAPKLKNLMVENRIDAGSILMKVQKYNRNLKNISVHNCWGSDRRINIPSKVLCNIIVKLPYLDSISLRGSRFISCKFFKLLATRDIILEKRKRNIDHTRRSKRIQYYGGAFRKQMKEFLKARLQNNRNKLALLSIENQPRNVAGSIVNEEIIVRNEEDIERILNSLNFE